MPNIRGIISIYASGVDLVIEWKIEKFFDLPETDGAVYWSPEFSFGGERWRLFIYPNGSSRNDSSGDVNLGLSKRHSNRSIKQSFSLSLKTVREEKYNEQHFSKDFDDDNDFHMFNQLIPRSELSSRRSDLALDGTLVVICMIKSLTSARSDTRKGQNFFEYACVDASTQTKEQDGARSLSDDYKKVLFGGRDHNVILKVGDKELRAHRDILRARSRVFESMLDHDMKEKNTGIIDVPDCDPIAMELFLSYVYCGKIEALDPNNMYGLYYVADKYEMMELKRECCNFIKKSLSHTNLCSVIQLALKHSDSDLLEYATGYFSDNVLDIMQTVEWQSFHKDNFTEGNELLMKSIKKLKNAQS